ncbi:MAG: hypothetical protein ACLTG7_00955 [Romboutsia sp.]
MALKKRAKKEEVTEATNASIEKEVVQSEVLERALYYVTLKYCLDTTYLLTGFTMKAKGITIVVSNNDIDCAFTITGVDIVEALISGDVDVKDLV